MNASLCNLGSDLRIDDAIDWRSCYRFGWRCQVYLNSPPVGIRNIFCASLPISSCIQSNVQMLNDWMEHQVNDVIFPMGSSVWNINTQLETGARRRPRSLVNKLDSTLMRVPSARDVTSAMPWTSRNDRPYVRVNLRYLWPHPQGRYSDIVRFQACSNIYCLLSTHTKLSRITFSNEKYLPTNFVRVFLCLKSTHCKYFPVKKI